MSTRKPKALAKVYAERKVVKEIGTVKCVGGVVFCSVLEMSPQGRTLPRSVSSY